MDYNFSINKHNKCLFISINIIKSDKLENIEFLFEKELSSKEYSKLLIKGLFNDILLTNNYIQKIREIINISKSTNNILVCNSESLNCIINILQNSTLDNLISNIYIIDSNMIIKEILNLDNIHSKTKITIISTNKLISKNKNIKILKINYNSNKNKVNEIMTENIFNNVLVTKELNNFIILPKKNIKVINNKKIKIKILKSFQNKKIVKVRKIYH